MGRGIYSALGRWPEAELPAALEVLRELGRHVAQGVEDGQLGPALPDAARAAAAAAVHEIRAFEVRVGRSTNMDAEIVATPTGRAIELGNIGHVAFGVEHEEEAGNVARALSEALRALGATGVTWFTMD